MGASFFRYVKNDGFLFKIVYCGRHSLPLSSLWKK